MIAVEIDGVWCRECKKMHPTLMWHKKFEEYKTNEELRDRMENRIAPRFHMTREQIEESIQSNLETSDVKQTEEYMPCVICNCLTRFVSKETGQYVCSQECQYQAEGKETEV